MPLSRSARWPIQWELLSGERGADDGEHRAPELRTRNCWSGTRKLPGRDRGSRDAQRGVAGDERGARDAERGAPGYDRGAQDYERRPRGPECRAARDIAQPHRLNQAAQAERSRVTRVLDAFDRGLALIGPDGQPALSNAPYREILGGSVEVLDEGGRRLTAEQLPAARAARGEQFDERFQVRKGRRRIGAFDIRSELLGQDDPGYTLLIVRRADEPG